MLKQVQKLSSLERLRLYIEYRKIKDRYTSEEQAAMEELFEEDGL